MTVTVTSHRDGRRRLASRPDPGLSAWHPTLSPSRPPLAVEPAQRLQRSEHMPVAHEPGPEVGLYVCQVKKMSSILNRIGIFLTYRALKLSIFLFESNLLPDFITRWGMRRLLETNLVPKNVEEQRDEFMKFVETLKTLPIAINTAAANEQVN